MITIEQLKDVKEHTEALHRYLDIDNKKVQVEEEQLRTQLPGFWDDAKKAEAQMKKVKTLIWIEGYDEVKTLADELELSFDFYKDELVSKTEVDDVYNKAMQAIEELELKNMLRSEADRMDCVLKINSGAVWCKESQSWASMLMRMYMQWAESNGYKLSVANLQEGDEAGIKTVTMNIEGSYAYGYLKGENGVHRLVRVSPYNARVNE